MASGIEARVPFLDHELVEFALRLPPAPQDPAADPKVLLRRYAERILPPAAVRRRKMPFYVPFDHFLASPAVPGSAGGHALGDRRSGGGACSNPRPSDASGSWRTRAATSSTRSSCSVWCCSSSGSAWRSTGAGGPDDAGDRPAGPGVSLHFSEGASRLGPLCRVPVLQRALHLWRRRSGTCSPTSAARSDAMGADRRQRWLDRRLGGRRSGGRGRRSPPSGPELRREPGPRTRPPDRHPSEPAVTSWSPPRSICRGARRSSTI